MAQPQKPTIADIIARPDSREGVFDRASANKEKRTVELSFSSEAPVERYYGMEILSHERSAVNLDRMASGRANLLVNHDPNDWVGVIESARIDADRMGRAVVRFGNSARAAEIFRDVTDGILTSVSVGYMRDEMKLSRTGKDQPDEYTVTRWTPFEASLVTVPADTNVGVGRAAEAGNTVVQPSAKTANQRKAITMTKEQELAAEKAAAEHENAKAVQAAMRQKEDEAVAQLRSASPLEQEKARQRAIKNLASMNNIDDNVRDAWITQGYSIEAVSDDLLKIKEERGNSNPQPASRLGLSPGETQRFSLTRAVLACYERDWTQAGFEMECSKAVAQRTGKVAAKNKFYVPFEVMERQHDVRAMAALRSHYGMAQRDLTVASAGAGGYLVSTDNVGFIEMLRNRSAAFRMGMRRLSGLQGSVTIPRQSAGATAVWLANEGSTITESAQTFVQIALTPKNVGAYTEISDLLLKQSSPGAEGIVTDDLAQQVALAVDLAAFEGSGSGGQPTGLSGTAGIGSVTGTSLAAAGVIEFQTDVAGSNVMPARPGYVTTPAVAGLLMVRPELPSTGQSRLWQGNVWDGSLFGMPAMTTNQLTAATMAFGDWQEGIIAEWGVLEVTVNPFANFQSGIIGVRALYSVDVGFRRPFAFSRATSIT